VFVNCGALQLVLERKNCVLAVEEASEVTSKQNRYCDGDEREKKCFEENLIDLPPFVEITSQIIFFARNFLH
jgi:hypothetical protein